MDIRERMKALFLSKTSDGAQWAALLARYIGHHGVDIFAVLPKESGSCVGYWQECAREIYYLDLNIRDVHFMGIRGKVKSLTKLISDIKPDIIHSFFFDSTILARLALKHDLDIPCAFHVPGPLHLENKITRMIDVKMSGQRDYWIASSSYTYELYKRTPILQERLFKSYLGIEIEKVKDKLIEEDSKKQALRDEMGIPSEKIILMNASMFYPPKWWIGQRVGIKNHERLIMSIKYILKERDDLCLVLAGKQWGKGKRYESYLRKMAGYVGKDNIIFIGFLEQEKLWEVFNIADIIVHTPISENCGGIIEPALLNKPAIVSPVGGLTEIVEEGITGWITRSKSANDIAIKILEVIEKRDEWEEKGRRLKEKVQKMFDIGKTSNEVIDIYKRIISFQDCR